MNRRERIQVALNFEETDRLPFSLWRHFPNLDHHPRKLAELTLEYQRKYDLDFIKFTPYGMLATIDWGVKLKFFPGFDEASVAAEPAVKDPDDWLHLKPYSGTDGEYLIALEGLRLTMREIPKDVPIVKTVFSPLTNAMKMCGEKTLSLHLREYPEKLEKGLEVIRDTTIGYLRESINRGAEGIFYSTQMSCYDKLSVEENERFVKKYDFEIFDSLKGKSWFNILHLHGSNVMFKESADYPVQALNWHDGDDGPSMDEARNMSQKCFCCGLSHLNTLLKKDAMDEIGQHVMDTWNHNDHRGVILGPGCVVDPKTPEENLYHVRDCVYATSSYR
ncbi:uroporphyrinogen decarboxylase family protein [Acetomicrobium sp. UBA5826]|uniref:uroporphyrinogen decarboxylase family protein n=1 Tax=Acetomicrobium sp. UBA5826 TaxID=1946039 RepID=UPI00257D1F59|nr:uroporphyrinogen decarboxylase family protein [Acetomicrobium sp. UBA5826]